MKKLNIYFNQKVKFTPWGGGNQFVINLIKLLRKNGHNIVFKLKKKIDLIILTANFKEIDPRIFMYKNKYPETKILHRINECDKRKGTDYVDKIIFKGNSIADETVFISKWLSQYFIKIGFKKSYKVIYNGCDEVYFFPLREKKLGDKIQLVTHHWSNNWLKGFDIYNQLDKIISERDDLSFTYIGNYNDSYKPKNTRCIPPLYGMDLGNELRKHDIYITASRWEPCGMHHIEGARCGLPVLFHSEGGGINEACENYGIEYFDRSSLLMAIKNLSNSYHKYRNKINYNFLSAKRCSNEYYQTILNMF